MAHFYTRTRAGVVEPRHFVPNKSKPGTLRPSTMRDANKAKAKGEDWKASVTTIMDVLAKPQLVNWLVNQNLEAAWGIPINGDRDAWIAEAKKAGEEKMAEAPDAGTDFHASFESFIKKELHWEHADFPLCEKLERSIFERTGHQDWIPEMSFVDERGFGGTVDLHNEFWILDFKTKQTADKFKPGRMVWDSHPMQLAAYREGLDLPAARCANIFVSLEDGQIDFHEHSEKDLKKGIELFKHCLGIWKLQKGIK